MGGRRYLLLDDEIESILSRKLALALNAVSATELVETSVTGYGGG
jgi:hypothetical protein